MRTTPGPVSLRRKLLWLQLPAHGYYRRFPGCAASTLPDPTGIQRSAASPLAVGL